MKKIFIYTSVILHAVIAIASLFNFDGLFKKTIKDNGHAVFDFISIGDKSTSPILSNENGKASKTKSYNDRKDESNVDKSNTNITKLTNNTDEFDKQDNTVKKKKYIKPKKENNSDTQNNNITKLPNNKKETKQEKPKTNDNKKHEINKQNVTQIKNHINKNESKKKSDNRKQNKHTEKNNDKPSNKNNNKALVNLKKQNKRVQLNTISSKKSLNSFLDNVLADGDNENTGANAESIGETLTATQVDMIRNTIRKCWHFPAGLKDAETLVVDIKMELDRSGYVKKAEVVEKNRMKRDSGFKIAAENAQRAVLDQRCNPLPLPKEKYDEWKDLELSFNPRDMLS